MTYVALVYYCANGLEHVKLDRAPLAYYFVHFVTQTTVLAGIVYWRPYIPPIAGEIANAVMLVSMLALDTTLGVRVRWSKRMQRRRTSLSLSRNSRLSQGELDKVW